MRIAQKKQAESIVEQLNQIHKRIRQQTGKFPLENVPDLLQQCQQQAMVLGDIVESGEGGRAALVSILEDYCECLYQFYTEFGCEPHGWNADGTYKKLQKWLVRIKDHVRTDINVRREAVFLPYKASMWDSMESIWKAADADPDCDAYVVPVPYYDRCPDGKIGAMHYEGNWYPNEVPVTDYREYDFQRRHPDMIFIHNPYDEINYVTSVHPFFYSKNLKQFTEKLVYVPYFVLDEIDPDDQGAMEWMENFCTVPGVIHADKVIVQSEVMRRVYIEIMTKFTSGHGIGKDYWRKKILGLGSPKMDKVCAVRKETLKIPEEWKNIIQKSDGTLKKTVLYNSSISGLLYHEGKMLKKMKEVFQLLRERQKEVALLWRPHPLLQTTIETMKPELLEGYREIVEQYRRECWGIYDDTPDVDRAVVLCDMYYGDGSSLIPLCREAGKMILMQNAGIVGTEQEEIFRKALRFENVYDDGDALWFAGFDYNALFQMSKKDHEVKLMGIFPDECLMQGRLYASVAMHDGRLYFAPYTAAEIAEYDLMKKAFRKIPLKAPAIENKQVWEHDKFFNVVSVKEKVYFLPYHYPGILCYEKETDSLVCFDDWVEQIDEIRSSDWGYFIDYEAVGNELILPCACADAIVIFDMCTGKSRVIQTPDTEYQCKFCGVCCTGEDFYLISADGTVSKRRLGFEKDEVKKIQLPILESDEAAYYPVKLVNGSVYCFPFQESTGFRIDTRTDKVFSAKMFDDEGQYEKESYSFLTSICDGEILYVTTGNSRRLLEYDLHSGKRIEKKLFLKERDRNYLERYKKGDLYRRAHERSVIESETDSLEAMLDVLQVYSNCKGEEERKGKSFGVGSRIYQTMIRE